ncbi:reduced growth phenotype protein 1 [Syncephalis fuscata]|nr:reduced growth phenotype protein 1 [Syncephalis fuscata]
MYQAAGVNGMVGGFGGGTLGITAAMNPGSGGGSSQSAETHSTDNKVSLPLFTTPPSIFFTNLTLGAGQEKTYQFQIKLPNSLPPSYRGRTIRFLYHLNVGIQLGDSMRPLYIARAPFRVFNRVLVDGACPTYDLLTPIAINEDLAIICDKDNKVAAKQSLGSPATSQSKGGRNRFLRSVFEAAKQEHNLRNGRQRVLSEVYSEDDGDGSSARNAMFRYQAARALNFNLSMNDNRVAKLSLAKTTLRLGDTLRGVLDFTNASLSCYHVSISLETMEVLAPGYARGNPDHIKRLSRRRHAEWHAYCHQLSRLGFSLGIPPELSPGFETNALSLVWSLHVELIVGKSTAVPLQHIVKQEGSRIFEAMTELSADTLNCSVPLQIYPCQPGAVHGYRTQQTFVVV